MNKEDLAKRLMATFTAELEEQLQAMNADLLGLERDPGDAERLKAVFRGAHTLKGAARAAGVAPIEQVCHAMEAFLADARDGKRVLSADDFNQLLTGIDVLERAGGRLEAGESLASGEIATVLADLEGLRAGRRPTATPARSAPAQQPLPRESESRTSDGMIRIGATKIDALLAATEQVLVDRGRLAHHSAQAHVLSEAANRWAAEWRRTGRPIRLALAQSAAGSAAEAAINTVEENLRRLVRESGQLAGQLERDGRTLSQSIDDLAYRTHQIRMRPFGEACEALPRAVRDLAAAAHKEVTLDVLGADVEIDRAVLDGLRDALLPLVRNAVDHGIEPPDARARSGKPREGKITVAAAVTGDRGIVTVSDDGAGLDVEAIRRAMKDRGNEIPSEPRALARALLSGGISTSARTTTISGRGVGLDIVREAVSRIHGTIAVQWTARAGTTFHIECPPTLATLRAVLVLVGPHPLAIPLTNVVRLLRVRPDDIRYVQERPALPTADGPVPLLPLARVLGAPFPERAVSGPAPAVLLASGEHRLAVLVDELTAEQEIVLRPLEGTDQRFVNGATILGTGRVASVLDVPAVIAAGALGPASSAAVQVAAAPSPERKRRVLVVDDSITTRTLEQSVLEAAGYEVTTAVDGADAWKLLQENGCEVVVADIEMPRMDGFDLTAAIRASKRLQELPVILVTALESEEHRRRGMDVGADAYIGKSGFDQQNLLDTIKQLVD